MNFLPQSRKSIYLIAPILGAILMLSFSVQPIIAQQSNFQSISSSKPGTTFVGNATGISSGSASFNFIGTGGNDTFDLAGGNASAVFLATGVLNNTFDIVTGNPSTGSNSTTFSLVSGANSTFNIVQNNFNDSVSFSIIAGTGSFVNDTSAGKVSNTLFSINLGTNSTASLLAQFTGNETTINVVY